MQEAGAPSMPLSWDQVNHPCSHLCAVPDLRCNIPSQDCFTWIFSSSRWIQYYVISCFWE